MHLFNNTVHESMRNFMRNEKSAWLGQIELPMEIYDKAKLLNKTNHIKTYVNIVESGLYEI